jgi:hypothetical protein
VKSEILCEFHCNNKCLLFFLLVFLVVSSLEFPAERFLVSCARETMISEWDAQGTVIQNYFRS